MLKIKPLLGGLEPSSCGELLRAVARARGARSDEEAGVFASLCPELHNPLPALPVYQKASARLHQAFASGQLVTFFGDYDADGITALAIMLDLARAAGAKAAYPFIPDRAVDDYGLTAGAVGKCVTQQNPGLIFTVDCGSSALDVLGSCRAKGLDVIVLDHHGLPDFPEGAHPAYAHLNPKDPACGGGPELAAMSAAGLAFLFAEAFATEHKLTGWSRERALILGGLGTYVDVMPLTGLNRVLVKGSLWLMNHGGDSLVPGLAALRKGLSVSRVTSHTYGFVFGPHLNAIGRLGGAEDALRLLACRTPEKAASLVPALKAANAARKEIQELILGEALTAAEASLAAVPDRKVILLANQAWHPGVVGIIAGRLKERFRRPVIVCGFNPESCCFKGSGRSVDGVSLGALVTKAHAEGVILGGGGHDMAAGVKLSEAQLDGFQAFLDRETAGVRLDPAPTYEVLGDASRRDFADWLRIFEALEPFGNGNPRPYLLLDRCRLVDAPTALLRRSDGATWALCGEFTAPNGRRLRLLWTDVAAALRQWIPGRAYRLVVSVSATESNGRTYENWEVVASERAESPVARPTLPTEVPSGTITDR